MQVNVSIGQNHHFALREALLIYRSTENQNGSFGNTFISHHEVDADNRAKQPTIGPAKTLTIEFVQSLVQALGGRVQAEFLPASVIARHRTADCLVDAATETPDVLRNDAGRHGRNEWRDLPAASSSLARDGSFTVDQGVQTRPPSRGRYKALCGSLLECVRHRERLPWIDAGAGWLHRRLHSPMGTELL